jgi:hypothetical protein
MKVDTLYGLAGAVYCYAFYSAIIDNTRPLKNPVIFTILKKTMDFFEVTGGRVLSFCNVSVGETAGTDLSGQCGGGKTPPWIRC